MRRRRRDSAGKMITPPSKGGGALLLVVALVAALPPCRAFAAEPEPAIEPAPVTEAPWKPADPWGTFVYEKEAPVYRLRLAIEELAVMAMAFTGYMVWNPPPCVPGVPATTIWEKLTFAPDSWYLDADAITTNFGGHVAAGTFYYMFARSNRVSVPEAFLWTLGTSTLWELVEYKEPVSINDMIVTPAAGIAVGEAFTQLSGWFDRRDGSRLSKAFAWIFDPMKKLHDWMDKATPRTDPAQRGWHEFRVGAAGLILWQNGRAHPGITLDFATRLFRAPGYGEAGGTGFGFADGNVSAIGLTMSIASGRAVDFLFDTETALVGHYSRDLRTDGDGLSGWDLFVGGTVGYEYGSHVWDLAGGAPKNQISLVRLPGVDGRFRLFTGDLQLDCSLDAAFDFGGVEPIGVPGTEVLDPGQVFPTVYSVQGYYFAVGIHLAPALELRYGPLALGASVRADWLWGMTGPFVPELAGQVVSLADVRAIGTAWLRLHLHEPSIEFGLSAIARERRGTAGNQETSQQDRSFLGSFTVIF